MPDNGGSQYGQLESEFSGFHNLYEHRVHDVLLVCSLYESFILEADGLVADLIFSEYQELNLSHAPHVSRVSTPEEALERVKNRHFDLVIAMTHLGGWEIREFAKAVKDIKPDMPVMMLAGEVRELAKYADIESRAPIDQLFFWHGDAKILLAIIKCVEDSLNAEHDTKVGNVRVIILIENSIRFYSAYLPVIYTELMRQNQALMAEGLNPVQKLLRMRARPKILLAETFEEGWALYEKYRSNVLGVISDVRFPRNGKLDREAGVEIVRRVKEESPHLPVLLQSSDASKEAVATRLGACFLHKQSRTLIHDLREFLLCNLGFGDFVFRLPDGTEVGRASDLRGLTQILPRMPDESILFHAGFDHFSNWLMARTEFELAAHIRPRKVSDFENVQSMRAYLIQMLTDYAEKAQTGVIADFSRQKIARGAGFVRLGGGSIGGKARGLAFISALLKRDNIHNRFPNVRVAVPSSVAVGTDVFDAFLDDNKLRRLAVRDCDDEDIVHAFLPARLPDDFRGDLAAYLEQVKYPLAVRSSSLLEDSHGQPFAGIYKTYMIPNNHLSQEVRLEQLCDAIKLVYASTFTRAAKLYLEATGHHAEEEKMGVILQEVVGSQYGDHFYPTFAGVARSYNFYALGRLKPEDGVACVALGLGKMVVEGGEMLMFSPAYPEILPQFSNTESTLANSQRSFYALYMGRGGNYTSTNADANLLAYDLEVAERDGTLEPIGSVYSPENDMVYDGINRPGARLVTFAHVLKSGIFPLAEIVKLLLEIGKHGMACPIEIEFAVNMKTEPMQFGLLQIRPSFSDEATDEIPLEDNDRSKLLCYSPQTMGNGAIGGLKDIVFVKPDQFDSVQTRRIAAEIGRMNEQLRKMGRTCLLIGPGRWGSADPWLGIPVTWDQICTASAIVETSLDDFVITPSQGTHFFQNLTSFRVAYLTVNPVAGGGFVDWDWLARQTCVAETDYIRHVRLDRPLEVKLDGRSQRGVIFKPNDADDEALSV